MYKLNNLLFWFQPYDSSSAPAPTFGSAGLACARVLWNQNVCATNDAAEPKTVTEPIRLGLGSAWTTSIVQYGYTNYKYYKYIIL